MAPEFVPFIVCGGLVVATLLGLVVTLVLWASKGLRKRLWPIPLVSLIGTLGLVGASASCGRLVYVAYVLGEPMAIAACEGDAAKVRSYLDRGARRTPAMSIASIQLWCALRRAATPR